MDELESKKIDEIMNELDECREDERSNWGQFIQIIGTAGAVLGILLGITEFKGDSNGNFTVNVNAVFYMCCFVFLAAFGILLSLGIENALRYHYIRELEDKLSVLIHRDGEKESLIHWNSFSAPIQTKNLKHLNNWYARISYSFYALAVFSVGAISIGMITYIYGQIESYKQFDHILFGFFIVIIVVSIIAFLIICVKAKEMYRFSYKTACQRQKERLAEAADSTKEENVKDKMNSKDLLQLIKYFAYPKIQDLQKPVLIVVGYFVGLWCFKDAACVNRGEISLVSFLNLAIVWLVIDALIYQARYQLNDIRGMKEDIGAGKLNRLPVHILGAKHAVNVSLLIMFLKLVLAAVILLLVMNPFRQVLLICTGLVAAATILYEFARSIENDFLIYVCVTFGYPLRLLAGMWAAHTYLCKNEGTCWELLHNPAVIFVLIGYGLFGVFSTALSWTNEVVCLKRTGKAIHKKHFLNLFKKVEDRYDKENPLKNPLEETGKILDPWNWMFLLAMICLFTSLLCSGFLYPSIAVVILILLEVILIVLTVCICHSDKKTGLRIGILAMCIIVVKFIIALLWKENNGNNSWFIFTCLNQIMFVGVYFFMRLCFDPDYSFIETCRNILLFVTRILVGGQTWQYLQENNESDGK